MENPSRLATAVLIAALAAQLAGAFSVEATLADRAKKDAYTLDFNDAYNPYCAYTPAFGCAIPRKEDHIDIAITAGEKKWHD